MLILNSGYRSPFVQYSAFHAHPQDRHLHGDAADIATGGDQDIWDALHDAAKSAGACVEPYQEQQDGNHHVHVDWRTVDNTWQGPCPDSW